jgi:PilZ domain
MTASDKKTSGNPADRRRSQRVLLQVSVLVTAQFEGGPPLTEDTRTVEINVHGALITLAMRVRPGQKLVIKNWSTAKEQECRVVHVREAPSGKNEVGISFPFPAAKFWNIEFPPPDWKPFMS